MMERTTRRAETAEREMATAVRENCNVSDAHVEDDEKGKTVQVERSVKQAREAKKAEQEPERRVSFTSEQLVSTFRVGIGLAAV